MSVSQAETEKDILVSLIRSLASLTEPPTREMVEKKARQMAAVFDYDGDLSNIVEEALIAVDTRMGAGVSLVDDEAKHDEEWVRKREIPTMYADAYEGHLKDDGWHSTMVRSLSDVCTRILGHLQDPKSEGHPLILASAKTKVRVAEPWRRGDPPLFRFETSDPWVYAELAPIFEYDDPAGIAWGDAWRSAQSRTLSEIAKHGETFEPIPTLLSLPKPALALPPPESTVVLDGGSQVAELADALRCTPPKKPAPDDDELRRAKNCEEVARLKRRRARERGDF